MKKAQADPNIYQPEFEIWEVGQFDPIIRFRFHCKDGSRSGSWTSWKSFAVWDANQPDSPLCE